jgi:hypothetical protein
MPALYQTLLKYDLGHLNIIAELWGLELDSRDVDSAAQELCASLLDPASVRDTLEILTPDARAALTELTDSKIEWATFTRKYGGIREMGAGKRDREQPFHKPTSTAETLFYRGLLAKAFFDSGNGAQEFAYTPDDFIPLINHKRKLKHEGNVEIFGRPATPAEKSFEHTANDRILDDATTLLAALRMEKKDHPVDPQLHALLTSAKIIMKDTPQTEAVKNFLASPRAEALDILYRTWFDSQIFNELRLIPGLLCEGEWTNLPRETRHTVLNFLNVIPKDKWWSLPAFLRDLKTKHPDFQRPAGDYDSWFIKRESDGQYLRGFTCWDQVDGAVVKSIIQILNLLGRADIASAEENGAFTSFRLKAFVEKREDKEKIGISSNGTITVPGLFPRVVRYQLARFCEWGEQKNDEYKYRISARSLKHATEQGLKAVQLLSMLVKHTKGNVPPSLVKALKRWEANGIEARVESLVVLKVSRPELLEELRRSKASKFLGEVLSPTAVVVREGAIQKVTAALAELGLLAETEIHEKGQASS